MNPQEEIALPAQPGTIVQEITIHAHLAMLLVVSVQFLQCHVQSVTSTMSPLLQVPPVTPVLLAVQVLLAILTAQDVMYLAVAAWEMRQLVSTVQVIMSLQELCAWLVQLANTVREATIHVQIVMFHVVSANSPQDPVLFVPSITNQPLQDLLATPVLLATSVLSAIPTALSVTFPAMDAMELQLCVSTVQITTNLQTVPV